MGWRLGAHPFQVSCCRCLRMAAGPCVAPRLLQLLCLPCLRPGPCSGCRRCLGRESASGSACAAAPPFAGCLGVPVCPWVSGCGWRALPWHLQPQCLSLRARWVLVRLAARPCGDEAVSWSRWLCRPTCALSLRQRRAPSARVLRGCLGTRVSSARPSRRFPQRCPLSAREPVPAVPARRSSLSAAVSPWGSGRIPQRFVMCGCWSPPASVSWGLWSVRRCPSAVVRVVCRRLPSCSPFGVCPMVPRGPSPPLSLRG